MKIKTIRNWSILAILLVGNNSGFAAQSQSVLGNIPMLTQAPQLDGDLSDPVWQQALPVELAIETKPAENLQARVKTVAYLYEDGENLYIGFDASDTDPSLIRAYLSDRDQINNSDYIGITIDTFNRAQTAFEFSVNPLGIQRDRLINERTQTEDTSWDAIWQSAGKLTQDGYQVEIKIPFKALRFDDSQGDKLWGIRLTRAWPRNVKHEFSNLPVDRNNGCGLCQLGSVSGFANAEAPNNLTLIPALTAVTNESRSVSPVTAWDSDDLEVRPSLDLRWGINQYTYLNATINPDFSQVEADALQLDVNNLLPIFLTEKRAFFLDGKDYFSNWSRLIYSRIFEEPEYGLKLTGKNEAHSYGVMLVNDKHTNFLLPDQYGASLVSLRDTESQNQVFQYRYDLGGNGNVGFTATNRNGEGYRNTMFGVDGKVWLGEADFIKFQAMTSDSDYPEELLLDGSVAEENISDQALSLNYTHDGRNWQWSATYHQFGEDFRADAGFISFANWERLGATLDYIWYAEDSEAWWTEVTLGSQVLHTEQIDGTQLGDSTEVYLDVSAAYQSNLFFIITDEDETYLGRDFDLDSWSIAGEIRPIPEIEIELEYESGDAIDYAAIEQGEETLLVAELEFQFSQGVSAELEYVQEDLTVAGNEVYDVQLYNLRFAYQLNPNSFLRLTLQAQELEHEGLSFDNDYLASQLIYSYKVNPFTLFYLGYSDQYVTDNISLDLTKIEKTVFMKFSYAWQQ